MNRNTQSRRQFLRATVVTTGGIALAGCSNSGGSSADGAGESGGDGGSEPTTEASGGATQTSTVEMTDELTFEPKAIEVTAGTEVTWENVGSIGHTVTAYEGKIPDGAAYFASGDFDSQQAAKDGYGNGQKGNVPKGESYSHTFETKGTYEYYCVPHEMNGMVGTVEVV
ncbi:plastocyanin/azurin family copper-binding protein [Haloarcula nitratireducens]|uniref:Twin-arginine translocation signal domain-containing protein n=1 Tax=Haloarcula nitratireducens TaxID=2487749 RepID=A0AAW4PEM4_9EURY|nr:plastocyanin/azurin family copper-binding protein [Halomicroarcula nitratireducens]MBX0296492.1 twin-arginine translocation signal domain-containing protein [Halomicroarcula nitratireducens]